MTFCLMSKGGVPHFVDSQFWLSIAKYSAACNSLEAVTEYILSVDTKSCQQSSAFSGMRCVVSKQGGRPRQVAISCMWEWKRRKASQKKAFWTHSHAMKFLPTLPFGNNVNIMRHLLITRQQGFAYRHVYIWPNHVVRVRFLLI